MNEKKIKKFHYYIDFDGVILDTNNLVAKEVVNHYAGNFNEVFNKLDWQKIYRKSKVISNNLETIRIIQNELNLYILTKIKSLEECNAKIKFLRENNISCPIIVVPINESKTNIIIPNKKTVLIDDDKQNIIEWTQKGGIGIHFINSTKTAGDYQTSSLSFLEKYI